MPATPTHLLRHVRQLVARPAADPAGDATLLERWVRLRDEDAFAALLARHGPMVLRVCRNVLADAHAAEDALQATFLVLARRAASVCPATAVAAWLFGVARRVALNARSAEVRRRSLRTWPAGVAAPYHREDPLDRLSARELLALVDEEVARLPGGATACRWSCAVWRDGRSRSSAPTRLDGRVGQGPAGTRAALAANAAGPAQGSSWRRCWRSGWRVKGRRRDCRPHWWRPRPGRR